MDKRRIRFFFPVAITAIAARLFFYPWDYELVAYGPVWIGTLLIMIFGIAMIALMIKDEMWRKTDGT